MRWIDYIRSMNIGAPERAYVGSGEERAPDGEAMPCPGQARAQKSAAPVRRGD